MQSPTHKLPTLTALLVLSATTLLAQGGGPLQPEFTGSPVPAGPNVNEFTGDFTYGLPVMTVPGPYGSSYTISLSYRAGTNPNAEVGWVGYGWSLNPGSIVREKRGFPDDWDDSITYYYKIPVDYTITSESLLNSEGASVDVPISGSLSFSKRYNSRTGFGNSWSASIGGSLFGQSGSLQYTNDNGDGSWEGVLSPSLWTFFQTFRINDFSMDPPAAVALEGEVDKLGFGVDVTFTPGVVAGFNETEQSVAAEIRPKPITKLKGIGYLQSAKAGEKDIMDYAYERDVPYNLNDNLLPVPFSNADVFHVSGGGQFRAFYRNAGTFHQNTVESELDISTDIPNIIVGAGFGGGYRWGDGSVEYKSGAWDDPEAGAWQSFPSIGEERLFFRFSGDMGGALLYDNDDRAVRAAIVERSGLIGDALELLGINDVDRYPVPPSDLRLQLEDWERPGRNSYIGFTRHNDMLDTVNDKFYKSWNRDSLSRSYVPNREDVPEQIGEFALFGPGGSQYVYGLPVHAKEEKTIQLGLRNIKLDSAANIQHNLRVYRWIDQGATTTAVGQEMDGEYATAWLLTEITTPDYVDLTGDGPTDDDLGGWTRFRYSPRLWQYWRLPFVGLHYDPVEISDPEDDLGSFSQGRRRRYYLDKIETKTHVALFILNEVNEERRRDAHLPEAPLYLDLTEAGHAGGSMTAMPSYGTAQRPRYLTRIELYTKDASGQPDSLLTTVHLDYDYSLRENMPSSLVNMDTTRYGMLTLRKVRTESHNVKNATIHPILFGYEYKKSADYSAEMQARYPEATSFADSLTDAMQNPDYSLFDFDPWGDYRPGGADRLDRYAPYVPQNDTSTWDPAAWQLKWIRSATGGEMHIQYEEDDYAFVQDRPALAMVSLVETPGTEFGEQSFDDDDDNKYFLRLSDIGIDSTDYGEVSRVRELIHKEAERHQRLLFRFLYALKGTSPGITNPEYNSEFITGHAGLAETGIKTIDSGEASEWYALYIRLIGTDEGGAQHEFGLPKKICLDYVRKRKRGKLGPREGVKYGTDLELQSRLASKYIGFDDTRYCKKIDYDNSWIRIPMLTAKKGGGLRVKRLLSYDPGIEGDSALYGTEYRYEVYDPERNEILSSGVASNEPTAIRDENALVTYRERNDDEDFKEGKIVAGRDRPRNEGPIGETLLPSPYVGYSRVVAHPIHQGATTSGFSIVDFYTYRDYPWDKFYKGIGRSVDYTELALDEYQPSPLFSNLLVYHQKEHLAFTTQGVRFVRTSMPGHVRRQLVAGGIYTPFERDWIISASTENVYFQPGDSIPLLYRFGDSIRYGYPGKTMEVLHATRRNGSYIDELTVEADAGFIFFSGAPYVVVDNSQLSTHVTTKIIDYPAVLKGVLSFADGNYNYVENVAFDPRSGSPVLTRSRDAFDGKTLHQSPGGHVGTYHSYAVPLAERYPELGPISGNQRAFIDTAGGFAVYKGTSGTTAYLDFPGGSENTWLKKLTPGDLVELTLVTPQSGETDAGRYHVEAIQGNVVLLDSSLNYNVGLDPAFARNGQVYIEVIRSGRANVPGASLGGVTTYGETAAEVATGANITWSGGDAAGRLALVGTLNSMYGTGLGTINSSNVDANLKLRHYTTGTCATVSGLGESWSFSTSGDTIFIGMATYTDTIVDQGIGGRFDLDDAGQIVFRSIGYLADLHRRRLNPTEQRVLNFTFCGDDPALRAVTGVIAASAGVISDTVDYDGGGVGSTAGNPNAYEKGERGRWSPRTAYIYRTDVVPSSDHNALERIYKDGGVFNEFSLFNWTEPGSSDTTHWIQLGSVTHINRHNVPYGSIDPLGRSGITLFGYGPDNDLLPILSAWNAEEGTVAFESFETFDDGDFSGNVTDQRGHAGTTSITLGGSSQSTYGMQITLNDHLFDKGGLLRFWSTHDDDDIRLKYASGASSLVVPERIARVGEWILYEAFFHGDSLDTYYNAGNTMSIRFRNEGGATLWIDDAKFQPSDAIAGASVFDPSTFRPVAGFDDRGFGGYPIYDGRSGPYASMIETSRGMYTLGDAHGHVPGVPRDWSGEGSPFTGTTYIGSPSLQFGSGSGRGAEGEETVFGADLLNLHLDLSGYQVRTLGLDPGRLRSLLEEKYDHLTEEQEGHIKAFERLGEESARLEAELEEAGTDEEREKIEGRLRQLSLEQRTLVRSLGIDSEGGEFSLPQGQSK